MKEPKMTQLEVTAVIPTGQYANIQPKITIEGEDFEAAYNIAMPHIEKFSREYGSADLTKTTPTQQVGIILTSFTTGRKIYFEPGEHIYKDDSGNTYTSGSTYAKEYEHPFNKRAIAPRVAQSYGVETDDVLALWQGKSDASTTLGTAVHQALETYGKWHELNTKIGKEKGIHPILLPIVEKFFTPERLKEDARYEAFVEDVKLRRCGQIDRLVITGDKHCIIEDYKTNSDLHKVGVKKYLKPPYNDLPNTPLSKYVLQLNFYRTLLEAGGWTVDGMKVHWWNNDKFEWETMELDKVEII